MRVLSTGRFSLLVVKGVMVKEPQDWVLRLTLLSVGEQGLLAAEKNPPNIYISLYLLFPTEGIDWLLSKAVLPGTVIYGFKVMKLLNFNNCGN